MIKDSFKKLYWGVFFALVSFRVMGVDIFPDIIGYILFAIGLGPLSQNNQYFDKAKKYNYPMIFLSILSIYQKPAQGGGINIGPFWQFGIIISIVSIVLNLLIVYNILMGIKDMAALQQQYEIQQEADRRWKHYVMLQAASVLAFVIIFIPLLNLIYMIALVIAAIALAVFMMNLMKRCGEDLH